MRLRRRLLDEPRGMLMLTRRELLRVTNQACQVSAAAARWEPASSTTSPHTSLSTLTPTIHQAQLRLNHAWARLVIAIVISLVNRTREAITSHHTNPRHLLASQRARATLLPASFPPPPPAPFSGMSRLRHPRNAPPAPPPSGRAAQKMRQLKKKKETKKNSGRSTVSERRIDDSSHVVRLPTA